MPLASTTVPVPYGPYYGPLNDFSGTVTTGGTAQQAIAANPVRRYLLVVNQSTTVLYVDVNKTAGVTSIPLKACTGAGDGSGGSVVFEVNFVPTGAVSIYGTGTGQAYTVKEG